MRRIVELREKYGMSQRTLAKKCGISSAALSKLDRGVAGPTTKTMKALSNAFAVSIDYLLEDTDRGFYVVYMLNGRAASDVLTEREVDLYKERGDLDEIVRTNGIDRFITGKTALEYFDNKDGTQSASGNSPNGDDFSEMEKRLMREISALPTDKFAIIKSLVEEFTKDTNNAKNVRKK